MPSKAVNALLAYQFPAQVDGNSVSAMLTATSPLLAAVMTEFITCSKLVTDTQLTISGNDGSLEVVDTSELSTIGQAITAEENNIFAAYNTFKTNLKAYIANI